MPRKVRRALARVAKRLLTKMTIFCFALGALLVVGAAMWLGSMLGIAGFGSAISATLALAAIALAFYILLTIIAFLWSAFVWVRGDIAVV